MNLIRLLVLVAALNGLAAAPFLLLVLAPSSSLAMLLGWGAVLLIGAAAIGGLLTA